MCAGSGENAISVLLTVFLIGTSAMGGTLHLSKALYI
jgi:hypothetical protein